MSTAENYFMKKAMVEKAKSSACLSVAESDLDYIEEIGGSMTVRQQMAGLFNRYISPSTVTDSSEIILGAGASYILDALVEAICDPGDQIMIATPYWSGLDLSISIRNSAKVLPVHIPLEEAFAPESVRYYEAALQEAESSVKAILVCNPNNPLGRCYPQKTMEALFRFCEDNALQYISDEVYALSVYDDLREENAPFQSALSLSGTADFVHVVYSVSKDFGCNGVRLGCLVTRNEAVRMSVALSTHGQLSSMANLITRTLILATDTMDTMFAQSREGLRGACATVLDFCNYRSLQFVRPYAGGFMFVKLCGEFPSVDEKHMQRALHTHGVLLASGTGYHLKAPGWFRICFVLGASRLSDGLARIDEALRDFRELKTANVAQQLEIVPQSHKRRRSSIGDLMERKRVRVQTVEIKE